MKTDERALLTRLVHNAPHDVGIRTRNDPRSVAAELGIPPKRLAYLCEKWQRRGWCESGVSETLCWFTLDGRECALLALLPYGVAAHVYSTDEPAVSPWKRL